MVNRFIAVFQLKYFVSRSFLPRTKLARFSKFIVFIVRLLDKKPQNISGLALGI